MSFASVDEGPECVVSGGHGTMSTTYKGKTYYFCCTGCRDAFADNPEKYIKEYEAQGEGEGRRQVTALLSMREVINPKGSRFFLCQLSTTDQAYPKYPPQPVVRCDGYRLRDTNEEELKR